MKEFKTYEEAYENALKENTFPDGEFRVSIQPVYILDGYLKTNYENIDYWVAKTVHVPSVTEKSIEMHHEKLKK